MQLKNSGFLYPKVGRLEGWKAGRRDINSLTSYKASKSADMDTVSMLPFS